MINDGILLAIISVIDHDNLLEWIIVRNYIMGPWSVIIYSVITIYYLRALARCHHPETVTAYWGAFTIAARE